MDRDWAAFYEAAGQIEGWAVERGASGTVYAAKKALPDWNWCVLIPAGQPIPGKTVAEVREFLETEIAIRLLGGK